MADKIPFQAIDWSTIEGARYEGTSGHAIWQTMQYNGLRIRMVAYSSGYIADHWCAKGHIVHCIEGSFDSELDTGEIFTLMQGMTYIVSDGMSLHKSHSTDGVKLMIIDGDFLDR